jgi:hypothetical protein
MEPLRQIRDRLGPLVQTYGFEPTEEVFSQDGPEWLEYRAIDGLGTILLSVSYARAERTVMTELWRPARVAGASWSGEFDRAAERRLEYRYGPDISPQDAEEKIADTVAAWLVDLYGAGAAFPATASDSATPLA